MKITVSRVSQIHTRITKAVSYTHLRAHETVLDLVCRLLLEKKKHTHHRDLGRYIQQKLRHDMTTNYMCSYSLDVQ